MMTDLQKHPVDSSGLIADIFAVVQLRSTLALSFPLPSFPLPSFPLLSLPSLSFRSIPTAINPSTVQSRSLPLNPRFNPRGGNGKYGLIFRIIGFSVVCGNQYWKGREGFSVVCGNQYWIRLVLIYPDRAKLLHWFCCSLVYP